MDDLLNPLLKCFNDADGKIRYASLEAMFFFCKSYGEIILK